VTTIALPWSELIRRTMRDAVDDDVMGQAAQLAYYLFLALFPAMLFMLAVASVFPLHAATDDIASQLSPFVSPQVLELIQEQMRRLGDQENGGLLTVGVAGALWSSSAAMVSVASALNRAYDIEEGRPWWKVRLVAIGLTLGVALFVVLAWAIILIGPASARWLAEAGFGPIAEWTWRIVQWPLAFALVSTAIGLVYYFAPDADQDWAWITPGAVVATILWVLVSLAFRVYITNFTDYTGAYGTVGGVIVLLLWFYVSSLAILAGAELNAEIEHASPHGKAPGQKNAAGKRLLGPRAARAFAEASRHQPQPPAAPLLLPAAANPLPGTAFAAIVLALRAWRRRTLRSAESSAMEGRHG
jgi:membrane protein